MRDIAGPGRDEIVRSFRPDHQGLPNPVHGAAELKGVGGEVKDGIAYEITTDGEISPDVIAAAQRATSLVWRYEIGEPTTMKLRFIDRLHNPTDSTDSSKTYAYYNFAVDEIVFAVESAREKFPNLSDQLLMTLLGGHEAMHRVQHHKGETLRPSHELEDRAYYEDPHEREAWEAALHATVALYPTFNMAVSAGHITHNSPVVSRYGGLRRNYPSHASPFTRGYELPPSLPLHNLSSPIRDLETPFRSKISPNNEFRIHTPKEIWVKEPSQITNNEPYYEK
jgi:hypothetical protein